MGALDYSYGIKDVVFGGLIAESTSPKGSWLNSILYGVTLCLTVTYWRTFKKDANWIRCLVLFSTLVDMISTLNQYIMVYDYAVIHWGDWDYLNVQPKTFFVYLITTGTSAIIMQVYLMIRIFKLSRNWILVCPLAVMSLVGYAGCWASAVVVEWVFKTIEERPQIVTYVIVWLAISAAADVCIAVFLVFQLRTMQGFTKNTRKMIRRLTFAAIETGSITASWALIALAVFLATPTSNIDVGIAYVLGRLYSITLLFNLIYRKPLSVMNEGNRMQTLTVGRPSRWTTRDDSNGSDGCDAAGAKAEGDLEYQGNACGVRVIHQREMHVDTWSPRDTARLALESPAEEGWDSNWVPPSQPAPIYHAA